MAGSVADVATLDRPAHRPSRRSALLDAGLSEFLARGVADTTISVIAASAEMTPAAVYYHFPSKEELLAELVRAIGEEVVEVLSPPSGELDLGAIVEKVLAWSARRPREAELYFETSVGSSPGVEALRRDHERRVCDRWRAPLRALRPTLAILESDVRALALLTLFAELVLGRLRGATDDEASIRQWQHAGVEVALRAIG